MQGLDSITANGEFVLAIPIWSVRSEAKTSGVGRLGDHIHERTKRAEEASRVRSVGTQAVGEKVLALSGNANITMRTCKK